MERIILSILGLAYKVVDWALWAYVILSWFAGASAKLYNIYRTLAKYMEPLLSPVRKLIRPLTYKIGVDFSPYVFLLLLQFVYRFLARLVILIF